MFNNIYLRLILISLFFQSISFGKIPTESLVADKENLTIVSWNIQDLGRSKDAQEIHRMAQVIRSFDIVAIQEVVAKDPAGAQAVAKIADELNRMGAKWDYRVSDPTQSPSSYIRERYAYLWKTSKVKLIGRPHLDNDLEIVCDREPYIAKFKEKKNGQYLTVANFHSRPHNKYPEDEIQHFIKYAKRPQNMIILGDFNLTEQHQVWDKLYAQGFKPAVHDLPTTLKRKCKNGNYFNHSIDNIYFGTSVHFVGSGRVDFVKDCGRLKVSRMLSDHVPVFMEFWLEVDE